MGRGVLSGRRGHPSGCTVLNRRAAPRAGPSRVGAQSVFSRARRAARVEKIKEV